MDYADKLRQCLRDYHEAEQGLITTSPELVETDTENYSDSYKWLRLPIVGEQPETVAGMIESDPELFPNDCLAGLLAEVLKNRVPTGVHLQGMCIDRVGTEFRFCISGTAGLEALRTLCGPLRQPGGHVDKK